MVDEIKAAVTNFILVVNFIQALSWTWKKMKKVSKKLRKLSTSPQSKRK